MYLGSVWRRSLNVELLPVAYSNLLLIKTVRSFHNSFCARRRIVRRICRIFNDHLQCRKDAGTPAAPAVEDGRHPPCPSPLWRCCVDCAMDRIQFLLLVLVVMLPILVLSKKFDRGQVPATMNMILVRNRLKSQ